MANWRMRVCFGVSGNRRSAVSGFGGPRPTLSHVSADLDPVVRASANAGARPCSTIAARHALFGLALAMLVGCSGGSTDATAPDISARAETATAQTQTIMAGPEAPAAAWAEELTSFRHKREDSLRSPEGWMALVGLHWLQPGTHSLGSGEGSGVMLAVGPHTLGQIELLPNDLALRLTLAEGVEVRVNGEAASTGELYVHADKTESPTRLDFDGGSLGLIERGGRFALRVRSPQAPTLLAFKVLNWFEPDPSWRLQARFEAHPPGRTLPIVNVLGQIEETPNPGRLHFELDGAAATLEALGDPADALFLIFADRSNARESYGAGRFLYTGKVIEGRVELDFNRSINPPCAYTEFSTCPLPPPENRLRAFVRAGEARYGHIADADAS